MIYLAYAMGGLFRSVNNGTTFEPVFESYGSASFGDIAIHPTNPNIVYAGTGEANNRQSSSFGDGIYKTIDGGKTWTNIGLEETQTISRVVIDPQNPEIVYVAANGHLFGPNPERGIYKTINGGQTWDKIEVRRREHGIHGYRDGSFEPQHVVCRQLSASPQRMLLQRRRAWKRAVEDDRRRQDVDEAERKRFADGDVWPNCARHVAL